MVIKRFDVFLVNLYNRAMSNINWEHLNFAKKQFLYSASVPDRVLYKARDHFNISHYKCQTEMLPIN